MPLHIFFGFITKVFWDMQHNRKYECGYSNIKVGYGLHSSGWVCEACGDLLCWVSTSLTFPQVFHDIAYKAKDRQDLIAGLDEFLDEVIVLPPGEWDPTIRIEPPKSLPSSDKR